MGALAPFSNLVLLCFTYQCGLLRAEEKKSFIIIHKIFFSLASVFGTMVEHSTLKHNIKGLSTIYCTRRPYYIFSEHNLCTLLIYSVCPWQVTSSVYVLQVIQEPT
jgi:hypothetical protein